MEQGVRLMKRKYSQEEVWQLMKGRMYINKDDANIFVRRKRGMGSFTMNLGNKWTWVIVGIELALILTMIWALQ